MSIDAAVVAAGAVMFGGIALALVGYDAARWLWRRWRT